MYNATKERNTDKEISVSLLQSIHSCSPHSEQRSHPKWGQRWSFYGNKNHEQEKQPDLHTHTHTHTHRERSVQNSTRSP